MFAGPNGSGKTTIKLSLPPEWIGVYVNPDDLEASANQNGILSLGSYQIEATDSEVRHFLTSSSFLQEAGLADSCAAVTYHENVIRFGGARITSYHASVVSDFLRRKLLAAGISFSFETVMSSRDKVILLDEAKSLGFKTYLYYVSTENPKINVARVKLRVSQGGHDVPKDKIIDRYHRSLSILREAVGHIDSAYFFDTSEEEKRDYLVAEVTRGTELVMHADTIPHWFKNAVYDKF